MRTLIQASQSVPNAFKRAFIFGLSGLVGLSSAAVHAFETRFEIDPSVNVEQLSQTREIAVHTESLGDIIHSDASAVLRVDFKRLEYVSADYDRYVEMKMPNVKKSKIVERAGDTVYTFTQMSAFGKSSKHYLEVLLLPMIGNQGAAGSQWQLTPRRTQWPFEEKSLFTRLDGSWFMQPLPDGTIYVRYFLAARFNLDNIPEDLVIWVAKKQLGDGVKQVIQTLARQAALQP